MIENLNQNYSIVNVYTMKTLRELKKDSSSNALIELVSMLSAIELDDIDFGSLKRRATNNSVAISEQDLIIVNDIIQNICVPLKKYGSILTDQPELVFELYNTANKVYKSLVKEFGTNEVIMKSWAKVFVANKQLEEAYELYSIGAIDYKNTSSRLYFFEKCQSGLHMQDIIKALNDPAYANTYITSCGGNTNIPQVKLLR